MCNVMLSSLIFDAFRQHALYVCIELMSSFLEYFLTDLSTSWCYKEEIVAAEFFGSLKIVL